MNRIIIYKSLPLCVLVVFAAIAGAMGGFFTPWRWVMWLAASAVVWIFGRLLHLLTPGTAIRSRLLYVLLLLAMAPAFVATGTGDFSRTMPALFLLLAFIYSLVVVVEVGSRWRWVHIIALPIFSFLLLFGLKNDLPWSEWSFSNYFRRSFPTAAYNLPNCLYLLSPWCHIGFFVLLPVLFVVVKKTDFYLPSKKILATGVVVYALSMGGLPVQNLAWLLPGYVVVLLLLFPAWDRFVAYGFYFLKTHWMYLALGISAAVQIVATVLLLFGVF